MSQKMSTKIYNFLQNQKLPDLNEQVKLVTSAGNPCKQFGPRSFGTDPYSAAPDLNPLIEFPIFCWLKK